MNTAAKLNIVVALPCEARILLDKYYLSRLDNPSNLPIYANKQGNIHLLVAGIGKINAALAVGYLHILTGADAHTGYLNIGIAGAVDQTIGSIFLAHKIIDGANQQVFYPLPILHQHLSGATLFCVDQPQSHYPAQQVVEMESSGFFQSASRFVTQEQIQVLKIISDNSLTSMQAIRPAMVISLMAEQWQNIQRVVEYLLKLSAAEADQQLKLFYFNEFVNYWHFTIYQQFQLRELLRRWQVIIPQANPLISCQDKKNAGDVLLYLHENLCSTSL